MKPRLKLLLCAGFLLVGSAFFATSLMLQRDYAVASTSLTKLDHAIQEANQIEILTLSPTPTEKSQKPFKTADYGETYFITASHILDANSTKELKNILADHVFTTELTVPCHTPGQVLRFYSDSSLLLETSLCLKCTNIQFYVYPFVPATVTILQKEQAEMDLPKLEAFLKTVKGS